MRNVTSIPSPFPNFLSILIFLFFFSEGNLLTAQTYALEFDGTSSFVQIDPLSSLYDNINFEITVEAWIFPTDLSNRHTIFSTRKGNASNSWQLEVGAGSNHSNVVAASGINTWVAESENNVININQWNHVAMVYQWDNNSVTSSTVIYVNGEQVSLQQETNYKFAENSDPVTIGVGTNGGSFFRGRIDEVRVWSVVRSQTEILEAMNNSLTGTENGLEAYYNMDDGTGLSVSDNSANNNTGTLSPDGSEPKRVVDFKSSLNNSALEFDGIDDLIGLQSPTALDVNNTVTVEAWVYPTDLSTRQIIYSTRNGGSSGCWQFETGQGNNNKNVLAVTGPGTWVAISEDNAVVPNEWNHVAFVRNGENDKGTFYVNGKEIPLQQQSDFTFIDNDDEKTIGNSFKGKMDEIRIWNIARTTEEIRQNMMRYLNGTETGLAACFRLSEGEGASTFDISSNAIEGTLSGTPQWVEDIFPDEAGTEEDPFIISSAFELYWLSVSPDMWDKAFQQTANIDVSTFDAWNLNEGFIPIGNNDATDPLPFSGAYDGKGYLVSNLQINRSGTGQNQGLFGYTNNATIKNTNLIKADINGSQNVGGLIGSALASTIKACSAAGKINGSNQTGGLIGMTDQNTSVINSYSIASVNGEENTGGLIGKIVSSLISNAYSIGSVIGNTNPGGLIGNNDNSTVSASFWNQESSGQESSDGGTVKSTSEMTAQATYINAGWDFDGESNNGTENIWSIHENINSGYPYISNQSVPPNVITGERDISISPPTVTGEIASLGTSIILDHGFCWNTNRSPTIDDNKTSKGATYTPGAFTSEITGLSNLTTYYIKAYATNESGTAYGEEKELVVGADFEGMGTEESPFKNYTLNDLKTMGEHSFYLDKHFVQMNDIDAYETRTWNEGAGWNSISTFSGVYDGQGYHIKNLYINSYDIDTGLFGSIKGGKVSNLGIINAYISSGGSSGALSGESYSAEITNCFSTGSIIGKTTNTYGFPMSSTSLGGLIGWIGSGSFISQCYSSANVSAGTNNLNGGMWIGGLSGMVQNATLINSYSTGSARGDTRVGGLTGSIGNSDIENSYSTASVSGNEYAGGVAGYSGFPLSVNSFHDQNKTGVSDRGASTTEEMTSQSFFTDAGWDFIGETENGSEDIWNIDPEINNGYPFLASQSYPHELITDDASAITATTATANAEISILGSEPVVDYGICWNTSGAPTLDDPKTQEGEATQSINFSAEITPLSPNTTYYVRAYIKDEKRITYGNEVSFTTDIKELTIGGSFSIDDKIFDETTNANISENNLTLEGIADNDNVSLSNISAVFAQSEPGSGILVSITNAELTGDNAGNYVLSLNGAPTTTANILEEYQLLLAASPSEGGAVTGEGTYVGGFSVSISAPPAIGWEFANWTDNDGNFVSDHQEYNYTMPSVDLTLTANFELVDYQITINDTPYVGGTTTGSGTANFGDVAAISATPETGYQFVEWTGDTQYLASTTAASTSLTMPAANVNLTANFELVDYSVVIGKTPVNGGTTSGTETANYNEVVEISATPETGYQFVEWTGDTQNLVSTTAASTSLTMPAADVNLTANFELVDYAVVIGETPVNGGTTSGTGTANYNEVVEISATPETGYQFVEWTGDTQNLVSTTAASTSLTMPAEDVNLTAIFELVNYQLTLSKNINEGGTISGEGIYNFDDEASIVANPAEGYIFANWTDANDNIISDQQNYSYSMPSDDVTLTANFDFVTFLNQTEDVKPMVWPNPFDAKLSIRNVEDIERIVIVSQSGQIVYEKVNPDQIIITSGLKPGIYLVKIILTNGEAFINKLIKQK